MGKPVLAHVLPSDRERVKDLFLRVLGGQEREWISRFKRGDGVTRAQWVRAVPISTDGIVRRIVDVHPGRDRVPYGGRPETHQLQTLLENLPGQLVAVVDREGRIRYSSGLSRTHFRDDVESMGTFYLDLLEPGEESERLCRQMLDAGRRRARTGGGRTGTGAWTGRCFPCAPSLRRIAIRGPDGCWARCWPGATWARSTSGAPGRTRAAAGRHRWAGDRGGRRAQGSHAAHRGGAGPRRCRERPARPARCRASWRA